MQNETRVFLRPEESLHRVHRVAVVEAHNVELGGNKDHRQSDRPPGDEKAKVEGGARVDKVLEDGAKVGVHEHVQRRDEEDATG